MWIYEQTKPEENFSLLPQVASLPVQKVEPALPPVPAQAAEPAEQLTQKEPCTPAKRHATRDCWLLAAAFLLGCTAAGKSGRPDGSAGRRADACTERLHLGRD